MEYFSKRGFSSRRILGLMHKEFTLIRRDRGTIALLILLPVMMLMIFGFAIKLDPKNLPTAIINYDHSPLTRSIVASMEASGYFKLVEPNASELSAEKGLSNGSLTYVITFPASFTANFIRGKNPQILVEVDGSDPGNSLSAVNHLQPLIDRVVLDFANRGLRVLPSHERGISLNVHQIYNETNNSAFDIVPGLIGVLLTLTMVMITSTAITSERESGTMELLLTTPLKPAEIIIGKIVPYVSLGYAQLTTILVLGKLLIDLPVEGSLFLLYVASAPFIIASLMVGMIFSTFAKTAMQAMQLSIFFQLPSMFLTGYVFTFYGMPGWARVIGSLLPMTYFMRITRGVLLKASGVMALLPDILILCLIATILIAIASKKFNKTLD